MATDPLADFGQPSSNSSGQSVEAALGALIDQRLAQQATQTYSPFVGYGQQTLPYRNRYEYREGAREVRKVLNRISADAHEAEFVNRWTGLNTSDKNNVAWNLRFVSAALRSGLPNMTSSAGGYDFMNAWKAAGELSDYFTKLGKPMTPMQALEFLGGGRKKVKSWGDLVASLGGDGGGGGGGGGYSGPRTVTTRSVNLTDGKTAKALTNAVLSAYLGREATAEEVAAYRNALNAEERKNPTTTVTNISADGSSQSSTTSGGLDSPGKEQLLKDKAMSTAEGAAYVTNNVFNEALKYLGSL